MRQQFDEPALVLDLLIQDAGWRRYLNEIDKLQQAGDISQEDYQLLRYSTEARSALMELTLGDDQVLVTGTIEEILERARAAARAETEASLQNETARREEAERKTVLIQEHAKARIQAIEFRIMQTSSILARWVARIAFSVGFVLLIVGTVFSFPGSYPESPAGWLKLSVSAAFGLTTLFSCIT